MDWSVILCQCRSSDPRKTRASGQTINKPCNSPAIMKQHKDKGRGAQRLSVGISCSCLEHDAYPKPVALPQGVSESSNATIRTR